MLLQRIDGCDVVRGDPAHGPGPVVSLAPLAGFVVAQDSNLERAIIMNFRIWLLPFLMTATATTTTTMTI